MPLPRPVYRSLAVTLAIMVSVGTAGLLGMPPETTAQEQRPNCANFLDQEDAQVAFNADPSDPFGLGESSQGINRACEQFEGDFGSQLPLVNCDDLRDHPDIAQALYDHSLSKYGSDRYDLAACVEQGSAGASPAAVDGSTVVVIVGAFGTGETLEARLEARFAALEAQFAAFEARAANGFGRFPESEDDALAGGQATTVVVSAFQQPITMTQRTADRNGGNPTTRAQRASDAKDETRVEVAQKVRKNVKGERAKAHKGKRDRHKEKKRNRR